MNPIQSMNRLAVLLCLGTLSACAASGKATTAAVHPAKEQPVKDAWIDTRLETAYLFNRHLNNFSIQTDVDNGEVLLTGIVRSEIDKDLAEEIAKSVNGVRAVNNHLVVRESITASAAADTDRDFARKVDDATTTATVKSQLLANDNLDGLAIDVDTKNSVVTLSGDVGSKEERQLAELIARNTASVSSVSNQLRVTPAELRSANDETR